LSKRTLAFLAAIVATTIYALNHTIAKGVMPHYIRGFGFILLRVAGAATLFWLFAFLGPRQRIQKKDWLRLLVCSFFGMVINMLSFFKGLEYSTPVNSAILTTVTPIIVAFFSYLLIQEKLTKFKILGIILGFSGAVTLILMNEQTGLNAPNIPLGNALFVLNATCYGIYLILVKELTTTYHPFVLMRWLFTLAVFMNLPVALPEFVAVRWSEVPIEGILAMVFVVVGTTFTTYLFNAFALTQLKASSISAFVYAQPLIGIAYAVITGHDRFKLLDLVAAVLVFTGVYLATRRPKQGIAASS
jgi:drug/metabolite transporter (DMT)-like permease